MLGTTMYKSSILLYRQTGCISFVGLFFWFFFGEAKKNNNKINKDFLKSKWH